VCVRIQSCEIQVILIYKVERASANELGGGEICHTFAFVMRMPCPASSTRANSTLQRTRDDGRVPAIRSIVISSP